MYHVSCIMRSCFQGLQSPMQYVVDEAPGRIRVACNARPWAIRPCRRCRKETACGLPPASARWADGRQGAAEVAAQSLERYSALDAWRGAWLELPLDMLLHRVREVAHRESQCGGRAYVGSTSDPAWRWEGGWYLQSEGGHRRHAGSEWAYMDGHRKQWRRMSILGSWRDADTADFEAQAIRRRRTVRIAQGGGGDTCIQGLQSPM